MGTEIERKFLVKNNAWKNGAKGTLYRQGYLGTDPERTVRVRLEGQTGKLTIKGKTEGISRTEYEYAIPASEAGEMLDNLCLRPLIEKTRYHLVYAGRSWEVDEFHGDNAGLVVAEVELESEKAPLQLPEWVGQEVSNDPRYFNASLVSHPFSRW